MITDFYWGVNFVQLQTPDPAGLGFILCGIVNYPFPILL